MYVVVANMMAIYRTPSGENGNCENVKNEIIFIKYTLLFDSDIIRQFSIFTRFSTSIRHLPTWALMG